MLRASSGSRGVVVSFGVWDSPEGDGFGDSVTFGGPGSWGCLDDPPIYRNKLSINSNLKPIPQGLPTLIRHHARQKLPRPVSACPMPSKHQPCRRVR